MLVQVRPQFNHSRYIHHVYGGRGFGSMFGRLFAKIAGRAARTGIRSAIKVGSKIAQKGITKVARKGLTTAVKSTAKQVLKKGLHAGKNVVKKQIKTLPKKVLNYAIKKSKDPQTQQSVQKAITKGAREVVKLLTDKKEPTHPSSSNNHFVKQVAAEAINSFLPKEGAPFQGIRKTAKALPTHLLNYAIKKSQDPKVQQSVQKVITQGARAAVKSLTQNNPKNNNILKQATAEAIKAFIPGEESSSSSSRNLKPTGVKRKRGKSTKTTTKRKRIRYTNTNINSLIARS